MELTWVAGKGRHKREKFAQWRQASGEDVFAGLNYARREVEAKSSGHHWKDYSGKQDPGISGEVFRNAGFLLNGT